MQSAPSLRTLLHAHHFFPVAAEGAHTRQSRRRTRVRVPRSPHCMQLSLEGGGRYRAEMLLEKINLRPEEKTSQTSVMAEL